MRVRSFIRVERNDETVELDVSGSVEVDGTIEDLDWEGDIVLSDDERYLASEALLEASAGGDW